MGLVWRTVCVGCWVNLVERQCHAHKHSRGAFSWCPWFPCCRLLSVVLVDGMQMQGLAAELLDVLVPQSHLIGTTLDLIWEVVCVRCIRLPCSSTAQHDMRQPQVPGEGRFATQRAHDAAGSSCTGHCTCSRAAKVCLVQVISIHHLRKASTACTCTVCTVLCAWMGTSMPTPALL